MVVPKKKFGQNFLVDEQGRAKIAKAMHDVVSQFPSRTILEIGPGKGDLTRDLLSFGTHITALEIDEEAYNYIVKTFDSDILDVYLQDAYKLFHEYITKGVELPSFVPTSFVLCSNLPFNVGSRILVDIALFDPSSPFSVILQQEVAHKASKQDGFTLFGAWLQLFWSMESPFDLPRHWFFPQPNVTSALLTGIPKQLPHWLDTLEKRKEVFAFLKIICAHPRKKILTNCKLGNELEKSSKLSEELLQQRLSFDNYIQVLESVFG